MREKGFHLVQTVLVLALVASTLLAAAPALHHWSSARRLRLAAAELVTTLRAARLKAVSASTKVGVRFRSGPRGRVTFTLHRDGDGDGVRTQDILRGIDPQLGPERQLVNGGARVRLGFPLGVQPSDPGDPSRRLEGLDDPIRFGVSDIASFNSLGRCSPGSLYLTDGSKGLVAVRVLAASGRVRVLVYDASTDSWSPD